MAQVLVRGLDPKVVARLKERARDQGRSLEAVLRGVRHRSTEPADPEQVSHEALIALIAPSAVAPAA